MKAERKVFRRFIGGMLVTSLIAGNLVGCGKQSGTGDSLIDKAAGDSKKYVFKAEKLDFTDKADFSGITLVGDRVYATTYADANSIKVVSFNTDGSDIKEVKIPESDSENHGYTCFDNDGNMFSILEVYANNYWEDEEPGEEPDEAIEGEETGTEDTDAEETGAEDTEAEDTEVEETGAEDSDAEETGAEDAEAETEVEDDSTEEAKLLVDVIDEGAETLPAGDGEDKMYFIKYDPDGNELYRVDIMEELAEDESDYISPFSMIWTEESGPVFTSTKGVHKFNEDSMKFESILTQDANSTFDSLNLYKGAEGQVFATVWGDHGLELSTFDLKTGKFGEKSEALSNYDTNNFFGGNGFDLYISKDEGIFGYDKSKDEIVKLLDYTFSDLNVSFALGSVVAISDHEFIANIPDEDYNYSLYRLTKVPEDQVKDKIVLTMAGNYLDYSVREKVFEFNQSSQEYRIKVVDYSTLNTDDNWNLGYQQFNLDIVSGNVPDIMFFGEEEPVDSYINKGLFLDLMPYLNNDPELANVEFVSNVFDAFKTGDKLYQLVPSFYVNTIATKTKYLDGKDTLTLKEAEKLIQDSGADFSESFGLASREYVFHSGLSYAGDKFIDWENKTCHFDGQEFADFLEFSKHFPEELTEDMWENYDDASYVNGTALFSLTYLNNFRAYRRLMDGTFGSEVSFIGFPNDLGVNCSVIVPNYRYAISSQSKHADVCWQVIRQFLLEDYQDGMDYNFPIRKSSFDKMAEKSMDRDYWTDEDGVKHYEDDYAYIGNQEILVKPLTREDVDYMKSFIGSLRLVKSSNESVNNIIQEEAAAFFKDQKSAEEVAGIIQSRVSIYVNENS